MTPNSPLANLMTFLLALCNGNPHAWGVLMVFIVPVGGGLLTIVGLMLWMIFSLSFWVGMSIVGILVWIVIGWYLLTLEYATRDR
jgi:hypothetical protein